VPYIKAAGELKSKPTQQSVAKLREIGITPHILVCRCEKPLENELREKISLFCNIPQEAVIEEMDVEHTIYELPLMLQRERVDDLVCKLLHLDTKSANMAHWQEIVRKLIAPRHRVRIGVVGKYIELHDAYKSVYEAISHGGVANDCGVEIEKIEAEAIEKFGAEKILKGLGGILVPGGFGERGIEGKILAAQYAREHKVPYLGLCLGMQIATIEFARNVLKLHGAHSTEFDEETPHPVIALLDEQKQVIKKGGTMRLGRQACQLVLGTQANRLYGAFVINERHRHRYEFNNEYRAAFEQAGYVFSGSSPDGKLIEVIEMPDHPYFLACQFHPEFQSKPDQPHPLFKGFIAAAHEHLHKKPMR
jgi:CTP synthase